MRILWFAAVVVAAFLLAGAAFEATASWQVMRAHPAPGRLIDIGSAVLHLDCRGPIGRGATTVLEAGGGNISLGWLKVQPAVAVSRRICAYDRAGQGWSTSSRLPRRPEVIADELQRALMRAGEAQPYVLVGHSRGGIYARAFAQAYPRDTAGLVLIDSSVDGIAGAPAPLAIERGQLQFLRLVHYAAPFGVARLLQMTRGPSRPTDRLVRSLQSRSEAVRANYNELAAIDAGDSGPALTPGALAKKPVIVVTSAGPLRGLTSLKAEDRRAVDIYRAGFQRTQAEFLRLSSCGMQVFARQSGHDVQVDEPGIVIRAIEAIHTRRIGCRTMAGDQEGEPR